LCSVLVCGRCWLSGQSVVRYRCSIGLRGDKGINLHFVCAVSIRVVIVMWWLGFESRFGLLRAEHVVSAGVQMGCNNLWEVLELELGETFSYQL